MRTNRWATTARNVDRKQKSLDAEIQKARHSRSRGLGVER